MSYLFIEVVFIISNMWYLILFFRAWKQAADNEMLYRRAPECVIKNCKLTGFKHTETSFDTKLFGKELRIKPALGFIFEKCLKKTNYQVSGKYNILNYLSVS